MREGFYKIDYVGDHGFGCAVIALDSGMIVGADPFGGAYDGTYKWSTKTERLDIDVLAKLQEGTYTVQGAIAPKGGLEFKVKCSFPREPDDEIIPADTSEGPLSLKVSLLRHFP